jgi:hypothetical protein
MMTVTGSKQKSKMVQHEKDCQLLVTETSMSPFYNSWIPCASLSMTDHRFGGNLQGEDL